MIEYSMDLSKKLYDYDALKQKVQLRVGMNYGTIPHLNMGLKDFLFTYKDGSIAILDALSDLNIQNVKYDSENKRIQILNVDVKIGTGAI